MNIELLTINTVWSVVRFFFIGCTVWLVYKAVESWWNAYKLGSDIKNFDDIAKIKKDTATRSGFRFLWTAIALQVLTSVIPIKFTSGTEQVRMSLDKEVTAQREQHAHEIKTWEQLAAEQVKKEKEEQEQIQEELRNRVLEQTGQSEDLYKTFTGEKK